MRRVNRRVLLAVAGLVLASCGTARADVQVRTPAAALGAAATTVGATPATAIPATALPTPTPTSTEIPAVTAPPTTIAPATSAPAPAAVRAPLPTPAPVPDQAQEQAAARPNTALGAISIPKLGLALSFYEGVTLRTLDVGPGHWPGTAMPGEAGNVVIAGHRVSHSRPFRNIDQLVAGDQVIFTVAGRTSTYEVTGHDTVTPDHVEIVQQTEAPTATLFACHPPGSTQFRWVVHLRLVSSS